MAAAECAPLHMFHLLGKKDFIPILEEFYFQKWNGFNAFTRKLNITPKQLSQRLDEMEQSGLLKKEGETYGITQKGKELGVLIQHIKAFHARHHEGLENCAGKPCSECVWAVAK